MKKLILMVGLPRSGKTTRAKELSKSYNAPIVSPDAIRLVLVGKAYRQESEPMVWAIAKTMVMALFEVGHSTVILDACNNTRKRREEWLGPWEREIHFVRTPADICRERARQSYDNGPQLVSTVDRMAAAREIPDKDEGPMFVTNGNKKFYFEREK